MLGRNGTNLGCIGLAGQIGAAMQCVEPGHFTSVASIAALLGDELLFDAIAARLEYNNPTGKRSYPDFVVPVRVNGTLGAIRITVDSARRCYDDPGKSTADHA